MKIKKYRSSTISLSSENFKFLTDPWLVDGAYYGSWFHLKKFDLEKNLSEINSHNAIYISHIHPDHFCEKTLKLIDKSIPVYIHKFNSQSLKRRLINLGFKVHELEHGKKNKLSDNVYLSIYAADDCNPELCFKHFDCRIGESKNLKSTLQIDTISVLEIDSYIIVNVNDSPYDLSKSVLKKIKNSFKKIDFLLTGYNGAGPYPQCFFETNDKKILEKTHEKKMHFLGSALNYLKALKPAEYSLFAGEYILGGKLFNLNKYIGNESSNNAYSYIDKELDRLNLTNEISSLNLIDEKVFYIGKNETKKYKSNMNDNSQDENLRNDIKGHKFDYELQNSPSPEEIYEMSKKAFERLQNFLISNKIKIKSDIYIKFDKRLLHLDINKKIINLLDEGSSIESKKFLEIKLDSRLFKNLLLGPKYAVWNNAEIGSHLKFKRVPDEYERSLFYSLNYFFV